ncbi:hypothetical protein BSBH6_03094 [Bacillus subtilis]|nr:hypothetical protein BSBH6_03094 [Bacillus subtilis]RPK23032.1 hypothetical protein BH5_03100 [Bacillus subtilis]
MVERKRQTRSAFFIFTPFNESTCLQYFALLKKMDFEK